MIFAGIILILLSLLIIFCIFKANDISIPPSINRADFRVTTNCLGAYRIQEKTRKGGWEDITENNGMDVWPLEYIREDLAQNKIDEIILDRKRLTATFRPVSEVLPKTPKTLANKRARKTRK